MPITYTSRKGLTYYLCCGVSKTGRPRYYLAREPKDEPVDQIPEGYRIAESINGVVSLVKDRPSSILPAELELVERELRKHSPDGKYRAGIKRDRIDLYERTSLDFDQVLAILGPAVTVPQAGLDQARADMDRRAKYTPVMRFILTDAERRIFRAERMCYRSSMYGWLDIGRVGPVERLAPRLIPALGTDEFFELFGWMPDDEW